MIKYFFLHLVKTGGTTIYDHIEKHLPGSKRLDSGDVCRHDFSFISGHAHHINLDYHKNYKDIEPRYIIIIRDPAEWLLSVYHHDTTRTKSERSFQDWYDNTQTNTVLPPPQRKRDRMTRYLETLLGVEGHEKIIYHLQNSFYKVFLTEHLNKDLPQFFKELGVPCDFEIQRESGEYSYQDECIINKTQKMTAGIRNMIYKQNVIDLSVYLAAKEVRERQKNE